MDQPRKPNGQFDFNRAGAPAGSLEAPANPLARTQDDIDDLAAQGVRFDVKASPGQELFIPSGAKVNLSGSGAVHAGDGASVDVSSGCEGLTVHAHGKSFVCAESGTVTYHDNSIGELFGTARGFATDKANVGVVDQASVYATDDATITAMDEATVFLNGGSYAEIWSDDCEVYVGGMATAQYDIGDQDPTGCSVYGQGCAEVLTRPPVPWLDDRRDVPLYRHNQAEFDAQAARFFGMDLAA